jgi:hypothetical protein
VASKRWSAFFCPDHDVERMAAFLRQMGAAAEQKRPPPKTHEFVATFKLPGGAQEPTEGMMKAMGRARIDTSTLDWSAPPGHMALSFKVEAKSLDAAVAAAAAAVCAAVQGAALVSAERVEAAPAEERRPPPAAETGGVAWKPLSRSLVTAQSSNPMVWEREGGRASDN